MKHSSNCKPRLFLFICLWLSATIYASAQQPSRWLSVDELFRLGTENSLQLKTAKIQESISGERVKSTRTERLPNIEIGASAGVIGQPIVFQSGMSHPKRPDTPDWSQNYNINLTQPLYQGGKTRGRIREAELQKHIAELSGEDNEAEIKLTLLQQYINLFSYYKQREVLTRNIEEAERRLKDISRMKKEGLVTRNDEIRSELQLTNDRLAQREAENSVALISQQLDILLGLEETLLIIPDTTLLYTAVSLQDYNTCIQQAYNNYPGMRIARQQTLLAQNGIRLAKANYLPTLALHAGNTLARPLSSTLADMYNNNWNIGLSLSYNLSSLYQNHHKMSESRQIVQLQRYAEEELAQKIRVQIKNAYTRHEEALSRIEALKLSVKQAEENYRIVQNRYLNQLSILTDLLDASSIRLDAELQLTVARSQAVYTYFELRRACGSL